MSHPRKRPDRGPRPAVSHAAHPRLNATWRVMRRVVRGLIAVLLLLAGTLAYLHWIGIPGWAADRSSRSILRHFGPAVAPCPKAPRSGPPAGNRSTFRVP